MLRLDTEVLESFFSAYSLLSDGISAPIVGPAEAQVTDSAEVIPDDDIQMSTDQVEVDASDATRNESVGIAWSGFVDPVYAPKFSVNAFQVCGCPPQNCS